MARIVGKKQLSEHVFQLVLEAPAIARKRMPGNFVIVRAKEAGERIPLTIANADEEKGTITLIVQAVGKSTKELVRMNEGENVLDLVGPLGKPTEIASIGTVVGIGGGIGAAPLFPIMEAYKKAGANVITILGARTKALVCMEEELRGVSNECIIVTDDGSAGEKGLVTDALKRLIERGETIDEVVAIGPAIMMKFVSLLAKERGIKITVSLNSIMIDGTGMCGGCRVTVGGETKFACVDGPEFDGSLVDFDGLMKRQGQFKAREKEADERYEARCKLTGEPIRES